MILKTISTTFWKSRMKKISLIVHPYIEAYIKKGLFNRQMKWFIKYSQWIKVKSNPAYQITEFHFFSGKDEEIKL
jgi:ribonuclease G